MAGALPRAAPGDEGQPRATQAARHRADRLSRSPHPRSRSKGTSLRTTRRTPQEAGPEVRTSQSRWTQLDSSRNCGSRCIVWWVSSSGLAYPCRLSPLACRSAAFATRLPCDSTVAPAVAARRFRSAVMKIRPERQTAPFSARGELHWRGRGEQILGNEQPMGEGPHLSTTSLCDAASGPARREGRPACRLWIRRGLPRAPASRRPRLS